MRRVPHYLRHEVRKAICWEVVCSSPLNKTENGARCRESSAGERQGDGARAKKSTTARRASSNS
eukprot:5351138-Pleurochrysis_carterae.AAC.2